MSAIAEMARGFPWPTDEATEGALVLVSSLRQAVDHAEKNHLPMQASPTSFAAAMGAHVVLGMSMGRAKANMERCGASAAN